MPDRDSAQLTAGPVPRRGGRPSPVAAFVAASCPVLVPAVVAEVMDAPNGLVVVDKPGGMTSRDAVNLVQRWFPKKTRVGHTGTLDPLATGVLVVCVGAATRLADRFQNAGKSYAARFRLGAVSDTDDADGTVTPTAGAAAPAEVEVRSALAAFVGVIDQRPPAYSAVKLGGERSHRLARTGRAEEITPRPVRIDAVRLVAYDWPFADVEVDCGKGTYIRSIARDLGATLGTGGLVETLRRTRVGRFTTEQGVSPHALPDAGRAYLLPMTSAVADLPRLTVSVADAGRLRCGVAVPADTADPVPPGTPAAVFDAAGDLVGTGTLDPAGLVRPLVVLERWK